jgi:hypothetical protein
VIGFTRTSSHPDYEREARRAKTHVLKFSMGKAVKSRAPRASFPMEHVIRYGLKIMERDKDTGGVISVRCQFCIFCGREENSISQRTKTESKKTWTGNQWRVDLYQKHHRTAHPSIWQTYDASSYEDKVAFFENKVAFKNTILPHVNPTGTSFQFDIKASIVDTLIGDMFFHPDDHGGVTQALALKIFQRLNDNVYQVTIRNSMQFQLVVAYIARGVSFRQIEDIIAETRRITGTSNVSSLI